MLLPETTFLSDLFRHRARCDNGIDHGPGVTVWMHPPVHRILGWATRPSTFNNDRHVWRLDQICALSNEEVYVKGLPSVSQPLTLQLLPSLVDAHLLNPKGQKLGIVADFLFNLKTGHIQYYLISRSDPRLPGTSRWRLNLDRILDQHPGRVETNIDILEELPLLKSSFKQDFLRQTRSLREQLTQFTNIASDRLEGWLDESEIDDDHNFYKDEQKAIDNDPLLDDWDKPNNHLSHRRYDDSKSTDQDPWI